MHFIHANNKTRKTPALACPFLWLPAIIYYCSAGKYSNRILSKVLELLNFVLQHTHTYLLSENVSIFTVPVSEEFPYRETALHWVVSLIVVCICNQVQFHINTFIVNVWWPLKSYIFMFLWWCSSSHDSLDTLSASVFLWVSPPAANGLSTISHEYLKGSYALDLEAVKQGACALPHLNKTLVSSCKRLNGWANDGNTQCLHAEQTWGHNTHLNWRVGVITWPEQVEHLPLRI